MSITVTFLDPHGRAVAVTCEPGDNLLRAGQAAGLPLEGTCEGQMACSTCHVIVDKAWFDKLPPAVEDEEDMLDLAAGARRTASSICCCRSTRCAARRASVTSAVKPCQITEPSGSRWGTASALYQRSPARGNWMR